MIKKVIAFFSFLFKTTFKGFYYDCQLLTKGFFFYFRLPFILLNKIKNVKLFQKIDDYFKKKQEDPVSFLFVVLIFFSVMFFFAYLYRNDTVVYVDNPSNSEVEDDSVVDDNKDNNNKNNADSKNTNIDINLYDKYGKVNVNDVDFNELKKVNSDVVAWLIVDGTSINYPIVQTSDNDYYLNHNILKESKISGWTFMDFRNSKEMSDANTIFYGHNLLNKTAFGSLDKVFTDKWFNSSNYKIVVVTENKRYIYEVFSCYFIEPEVYYLSNNFNNNSEYKNFLDTLVGRSKYNFNVDLDVNDKIITLSTCTEDNKGRKVVHAKLIG